MKVCVVTSVESEGEVIERVFKTREGAKRLFCELHPNAKWVSDWHSILRDKRSWQDLSLDVEIHTFFREYEVQDA